MFKFFQVLMQQIHFLSSAMLAVILTLRTHVQTLGVSKTCFHFSCNTYFSIINSWQNFRRQDLRFGINLNSF